MVFGGRSSRAYNRSLAFHWFPEEKNSISFAEAKERVFLVIDSMEKALKECKIKVGKQTK
ncbi:MAG: hypothetical protein Q8P91_03690 [bacterium]|nr:hypothetical protein [bacterium]